MCLLTRFLQPPYVVPFRQFQPVPFDFLHCLPHGKPACHLLVDFLQLAYKGLAPSGISNYLRQIARTCWAHIE